MTTIFQGRTVPVLNSHWTSIGMLRNPHQIREWDLFLKPNAKKASACSNSIFR